MVHQQFIDEMLEEDRGRIVACNLVAGLDEGLFDREFAHSVLTWWRAAFLFVVKRRFAGVLPRQRRQEVLMEALDRVLLDGPLPPDFPGGDRKPDFRFSCIRMRPGRRARSGFVNVIRTANFIKHAMHPEERDRLAGGYGLFVSSDPAEGETDTLTLQGCERLRLNPSASIGRPDGVCWVAPTPPARALLDGPTAATSMRDHLGLIHHSAGRSLLALHLPGGAVAQGGATRPTFADAGSHARFMTRADQQDQRRRYSWGHTANLEGVASGSPSIDGLPERVCQPIRGDKLGTVLAQPLGQVTGTRGEVRHGKGRDDDAAFAERLGCSMEALSMIRDVLVKLMERA